MLLLSPAFCSYHSLPVRGMMPPARAPCSYWGRRLLEGGPSLFTENPRACHSRKLERLRHEKRAGVLRGLWPSNALKIPVFLVDNEATRLARSLTYAHILASPAPRLLQRRTEEEQLEHGRDELAEQRRKKQLTLAGRELLEEIERVAESSEPLSEEILVRVNALPPSDQAELACILGARAHGTREEGHRRHDELTRSVVETIREAHEHELATGRRAKPHLTLREALEILGR
jgi:hypothetical protein